MRYRFKRPRAYAACNVNAFAEDKGKYALPMLGGFKVDLGQSKSN